MAILGLLVVGFLAGCNNSLPDSAEQIGRELHLEQSLAISQASEPYIDATTPGAEGYKIGPLDVLDVTVFKAPELSRSVQVGTSGLINLPLIGEVHAAGKTSAAVERDIAARYNAGYLKSPQITVFVREYNSSRVTVDGAVKEPGVYPTRGHDTLTGAISLAKGLDTHTASNGILLFRKEPGGARTAIRYNLSDIRTGKSPDPGIHSGDVIVVESSVTKEMFARFKELMPLASPLSWALISL